MPAPTHTKSRTDSAPRTPPRTPGRRRRRSADDEALFEPTDEHGDRPWNESGLSRQPGTPTAQTRRTRRKSAPPSEAGESPLITATRDDGLRAPATLMFRDRLLRPSKRDRRKIERMLCDLERAVDGGEMSHFDKGDRFNALRSEYRRVYKTTLTLKRLKKTLGFSRSPQRLGQLANTADYFPKAVRDPAIPFRRYEEARTLNQRLHDEKTPAELVEVMRNQPDAVALAEVLGVPKKDREKPLKLTISGRYVSGAAATVISYSGEAETDRSRSVERLNLANRVRLSAMGVMVESMAAYAAERAAEEAEEGEKESKPDAFEARIRRNMEELAKKVGELQERVREDLLDDARESAWAEAKNNDLPLPDERYAYAIELLLEHWGPAALAKDG